MFRHVRVVIPAILAALFIAHPMSTLPAVVMSAWQGGPRIEIGDDLPLSDGPDLPLAESHVSANPNNPNQLLVGVIQINSSGDKDQSCVSWASRDGGHRWTRHEFPVKGCNDPWGAVLADGTAIMAVLDIVAGDVAVFRSADGGVTWPENPVRFAGAHDHPMLVARDNEVYVVSTKSVPGVRSAYRKGRAAVSVARSVDGGKTFGPEMPWVATNLLYEAVTRALFSDGMLAVAIQDHHYRSSSGWEALARTRTWMLRSTDQGRTFTEPLFLSQACEGQGGWESLASDPGDRLYWLCVTDNFDGVIVQRSEDRGESWSNPLRINGGAKANSHTPSIAINTEAVVGVSWLERHDGSCLDTYFTASVDSGKTFLPAVKVSKATSCPDTPRNATGFALFPFGGHYSGLTATADGRFHVVWSDARAGVYQLRHSTIAVKRQ